MAIKEITKEEIARNQIEGNLPDRPSQATLYGGKVMTPAEVKAAHDKLPKLIAERFNALITAIRLQGEDSLAAEILTGIRAGHTLSDLFGDITDGGFASYLKVGEKTLADFYERFLGTLSLIGEGAPTEETAAERGTAYLQVTEGKIREIYYCDSDGAPYLWRRYVPQSDYYIPSVKDGVLSFTPTDPDMPALPDADIDPLPEVTDADEGKVLTAEGGAWKPKALEIPDPLPAITEEDEGKVLTAEGGAWLPKDAPTELPVIGTDYDGRVLSISGGKLVWLPPDKCECGPELPVVDATKDGYVLMVDGGVWVAKNHVVHADAPLLKIEDGVATASTTSLFGGGVFTFYKDGVQFASSQGGTVDLSAQGWEDGIYAITATLQVSNSAYRVSDHSNTVLYIVGDLSLPSAEGVSF